MVRLRVRPAVPSHHGLTEINVDWTTTVQHLKEITEQRFHVFPALQLLHCRDVVVESVVRDESGNKLRDVTLREALKPLRDADPAAGSFDLFLTDFTPLWGRAAKGYLKIENTAYRGITVAQLGRLTQFLCHHSDGSGHIMDWLDRSKDSPSYGKRMRWNQINLYQVNDWVICPFTSEHRCSFVERIAVNAEEQRPSWFVSHWWGEPVSRFVSCLEMHSNLRRVDRGAAETTAYWVCAYANNQHELGAEIKSDPKATSFFRAMQITFGVLLVLGDEGVAFARVWCAFEMATAITERSLLFDIAVPKMQTRGRAAWDMSGVSDKFEPTLITTNGLLPHEASSEDEKPGSGMLMRAKRVAEVPIELMCRALRIDVESARATLDEDRRRILNTIARVDVRSLDNEPPRGHSEYRRINTRLRSLFAQAGWLSAVKQERADILANFVAAIKADEENPSLHLCSAGCEQFGNDRLEEIGVCIHPGLRDLDLNMCLCRRIDNAGIERLAAHFREPLYRLSLVVSFCQRVDDEGFEALAKHLPRSLKVLQLSANGCPGLSNRGIVALAHGLPPDLHTLELNCSTCSRDQFTAITANGFKTLLNNLPSSLEVLRLNFHNNKMDFELECVPFLIQEIEIGNLRRLKELHVKPRVLDLVQIAHRLDRKHHVRMRWQKAIREICLRVLVAKAFRQKADPFMCLTMKRKATQVIDEDDVEEMKAFGNRAPEEIKRLMSAIYYLLRPQTEKKGKHNRNSFQFNVGRMFKQSGFIESVRCFNAEQVSPQVLVRVKDLTHDLNVEQLQTQSRAAAKFSRWVASVLQLRELSVSIDAEEHGLPPAISPIALSRTSSVARRHSRKSTLKVSDGGGLADITSHRSSPAPSVPATPTLPIRRALDSTLHVEGADGIQEPQETPVGTRAADWMLTDEMSPTDTDFTTRAMDVMVAKFLADDSISPSSPEAGVAPNWPDVPIATVESPISSRAPIITVRNYDDNGPGSSRSNDANSCVSSCVSSSASRMAAHTKNVPRTECMRSAGHNEAEAMLAEEGGGGIAKSGWMSVSRTRSVPSVLQHSTGAVIRRPRSVSSVSHDSMASRESPIVWSPPLSASSRPSSGGRCSLSGRPLRPSYGRKLPAPLSAKALLGRARDGGGRTTNNVGFYKGAHRSSSRGSIMETSIGDTRGAPRAQFVPRVLTESGTLSGGGPGCTGIRLVEHLHQHLHFHYMVPRPKSAVSSKLR